MTRKTLCLMKIMLKWYLDSIYISHQKIEHHKLDWKAEARTDTRNKTYTPPSKDVKKVKLS